MIKYLCEGFNALDNMHKGSRAKNIYDRAAAA